MKHHYLTSILFFCLWMTSVFASAYDIAVPNDDGVMIYYEYASDSELSVTYAGTARSYWPSYSGDIVIPQYVNYEDKTLKVRSIGYCAFYYCTDLNTITLPEGMTSIDGYAFYNCTGLSFVNIPKSVTDIYSEAFGHCSGLTSMIIPNGVTYIGSSAFENCSALTSITIGSSVKEIGSSVFNGCHELSTIKIDSSNPTYDSRDNCNAIILTEKNELKFGCKGTIIPSSVTSIGDNAFSRCTGLTSMDIPDNIMSIGSSAFSGCTSLYSITIPSSVTSIGDYTFSGCTGLTSMDIPGNIITIGSSAFSGCTSLYSITIPSGVTSIGDNAFSGCTSLYSITIPNSVISIGSSPFYGCSELSMINIAPGNPKYDSRDNCNAIILTENNELLFGCKETIIPNSVTSIGPYAFNGCASLTSITIPSSIITLGLGVFQGCTGLTSVSIPNSVISIDNSAFLGCTNLSSLVFPNSVTTIGDNAFKDTPWFEHQPDGVVYAGPVAYCYKGTMPANCQIDIKDGTKVIAQSLFSGHRDLTSVTIPNGVTSIGYRAFHNCSGLTSATLPNSVTTVGSYAFYGCSGLTSISNSMTSIGDYAFDGCKGLTAITFPEDVTNIGKGAFQGCSNIITINMPKRMDRLEFGTFMNCSSLSSIIIPTGVSMIDTHTFSGCSNLQSVVIPESVTFIGFEAFSGSVILDSIKCMAKTPPTVFKDEVFGEVDKSTCLLIVPDDAIGAYRTADVWRDFVHIISISDYERGNETELANHLAISSLCIKPGETKEIVINLNNVDEVKAVQGNIKLPDGLKFVTKDNGRLNVRNIDERSEDFTLACALQEDGSMTFTQYSADGFAYEGHAGGIFTFMIEAEETVEQGSYEIKLSDVVLSIDGVGYEMPDRNSKVVIKRTLTDEEWLAKVEEDRSRYYKLFHYMFNQTGIYEVNYIQTKYLFQDLIKVQQDYYQHCGSSIAETGSLDRRWADGLSDCLYGSYSLSKYPINLPSIIELYDQYYDWNRTATLICNEGGAMKTSYHDETYAIIVRNDTVTYYWSSYDPANFNYSKFKPCFGYDRRVIIEPDEGYVVKSVTQNGIPVDDINNIYVSEKEEMIEVEFAPDPVGIECLPSDSSSVGKRNIYNLAGQRLSKPQRGLNIVDGRKVMIR